MRTAGAALLVALALVSGSAAAGGGPSPGVSVGWDGVVDAAKGVRYVAMPAERTTTVAVVRTADGRVLRYATVKGVFGVPLVAFDGTAEGLSREGKTLVLADATGRADQTRFAVLRTRTMRLVKTVRLRGLWAFDALSPDGRTLYALQYLTTGRNPQYSVRSVSLVSGKPVGRPIVDGRGPGDQMSGAPWARARSADGAWAYTLYAKPNGTAFVHALDTARRRAYCVDLPWRTTTQALARVRLSLQQRGRSLVLSKPGARRLAVVDTRTFKVQAFARP